MSDKPDLRLVGRADETPKGSEKTESAKPVNDPNTKVVLELLKDESKKIKGVNKTEPLQIAGQEIVDVKKSYENLREALALIKKFLGKRFDVRLEEIFLKKLPGEQVGESTELGEEIDPILLLHPAVRLAHVIAHEMAHRRKRIMNEAVVEAYVKLWFGADESHHGNENAIAKYEVFARKFAKNGDVRTGVKELYELYDARNFDKIRDRHSEILFKEKQKRDGKEAVLDEVEAYKDFKEIFPELNFTPAKVKGQHFNLKHPDWPEEDDTPDNKLQGVSALDVRAKIEKTEERVRRRA